MENHIRKIGLAKITQWKFENTLCTNLNTGGKGKVDKTGPGSQVREKYYKQK
jgi:hypothetical protein